MEDSVGDLFTKEESHEVFWPFFYVRVFLSMHFMKFPMIKTNRNSHALFALETKNLPVGWPGT